VSKENVDGAGANANKREMALLILLLAVLVPLEIVCARLAYKTLGEVTSSLYLLVVGLNLVFILLAQRRRGLAAAGIVLLALAIIPYQLYLGDRLLRVQDEAGRIVAYAYEEKIATGDYPPTLEAYTFHDPDAAPFIQRYAVEADGSGFALAYRVGTDNTSHTYTSQTGWSYYAD
jgi:hypothetical protein